MNSQFAKLEDQQEIFYDEELGEIKLFRLRKEAYYHYIEGVKNCEGLTHYQARLKLTRNCIVGKKMETINGRTLYYYGNLAIVVAGGERIVWIENYKNNSDIKHYINYQLRDKLNEIFGIIDDRKNIDILHKDKIKNKFDKIELQDKDEKIENIIQKFQNKIYQVFGVSENLLKGEGR